jgi:DNA-binding NtrC family response regulator
MIPEDLHSDVLIIDSDRDYLEKLAFDVASFGWTVAIAHEVDSVLQHVSALAPDVILIQIDFDSFLERRELIRSIRLKRGIGLKVFAMTPFQDPAALKCPEFDYIFSKASLQAIDIVAMKNSHLLNSFLMKSPLRS